MGGKSLFPNLDDYIGLSYTSKNHIPILPLSTRELLDAAEKFVKRIEKNKPVWLQSDDLLFMSRPPCPLPNFHATGQFAEYPTNRDVEIINHPPYEVINRRQVKYRPRIFYDAWDCENEVDFFYAPQYRSIQASFPEPIKFYSNEFKPFFDACRPDPRFFFPPGSDVELQMDRLVNHYFKSKDRYKPYLKDITLSFNLIGKIKKLSQPPDYLLFAMHHMGLHIPGFLDCYQTESGKYLLYNGYFNFSFPIIGQGKFPKWTIEERLVYLYLNVRTFHELEWKINHSGNQQFCLPQFEINEKRSKEMDGFGRAVLSRIGFHRYYHFSVTSGALRLSLFTEKEFSFIKRFKDCIFVQDNEQFEADRTELYINLDFVEYIGKKVLSVRNPPNLHPPPAEIPLDYTKIPLLFGSCLTPDEPNHHSHTAEEDIETAETAAAAMLRASLANINNEDLTPEDENVAITIGPYHNTFYRTPTKYLYKGIAMQDNMVIDRGPYKNSSAGRRSLQQPVMRGSYTIADPNTRLVTPPPRLLAAEPQTSYRVVGTSTGQTAYRISPPTRPLPVVTRSRQTPVPSSQKQQLFKSFNIPFCNRTDPINLPPNSTSTCQKRYPLKRLEFGGVAKPKYVVTDPMTQTYIAVNQFDKRIQRPKAPDSRFYMQRPADPLTKTVLRTHRNSATVLVAQGSLPGRVTRATPLSATMASRQVIMEPPSTTVSPITKATVPPSTSLSSPQSVAPINVRVPEAEPAEVDIPVEELSGDASENVSAPTAAPKVLPPVSVLQEKNSATVQNNPSPMKEMDKLYGIFVGHEQGKNASRQGQETGAPKKRRGRPRNEDRLPEITAVEPLSEKERAERRKNNRTRTRFCNKVPEYKGLPNPTKVRDPRNPKTPKVPLRVYLGKIRNNGVPPPKTRGRPRKMCYARGRNGAYVGKLLVALCQKKGDPIPMKPTLPDDELEKLTAEAHKRNIFMTYGQSTNSKRRRPISRSPFFFTQPKKRKPKRDPKKPKERKKKKKSSILMSGKQPRIRAPRYDSWDGLWPTSRLNALKEWLAEPIDFTSLDSWHLPPPTITDAHDPNELWNAAPVARAKYAKDVLPAPDDYIWKDYDPIVEKYRKEAEVEGVEKDPHPELLVPEEGPDGIEETPEPVPTAAAEAEKAQLTPQWEMPPLEDYPEPFAPEEQLVDEKALGFTQPIAVHRVDVAFDPVENIVPLIEKPAEQQKAEEVEKPVKPLRHVRLTKALIRRLRHPKSLPYPLLKWKHRKWKHHQAKTRMVPRAELIKRKEMGSAKADLTKNKPNIGKKPFVKLLDKEEYDMRHVRDTVDKLVKRVDKNVRISESKKKRKAKQAVERLERSIELEATPLNLLHDPSVLVLLKDIQPALDSVESSAVESGLVFALNKPDTSVSSLQSTEFVSAVQLTEHISKDVLAPERVEPPLSIAVVAKAAEATVDIVPPVEEVFSAGGLHEKEGVPVADEHEAPALKEATALVIDVPMSMPETSTKYSSVDDGSIDEELELVLTELVEKVAMGSDVLAAPDELERSLTAPVIDHKIIEAIGDVAEDIAVAAAYISPNDILIVEESEARSIPEQIVDLVVPQLESKSIDTLEISEEPTGVEQLHEESLLVADESQSPDVEEGVPISVAIVEPEKILDDQPPKELSSLVISELPPSKDDALLIDDSEIAKPPEELSAIIDVSSKILGQASIADRVPPVDEEDLPIVSQLLEEVITAAIESAAVSDVVEIAVQPQTMAVPIEIKDVSPVLEEASIRSETEDAAEIQNLITQLLLNVETLHEAESVLNPTLHVDAVECAPESITNLEEDLADLIENREDRIPLKVAEGETESTISAISNNNAVAEVGNDEQNPAQPLLVTRKRRLFSDDTEQSDETMETPQRKRIFSATDSSAPSSVRPIEALEIESETLEPIPEVPPEQHDTSAASSTDTFDATNTEDLDFDIKPRGPIRKTHADADAEEFYVTPPFKCEPRPTSTSSVLQRYAPKSLKPPGASNANIISNDSVNPEFLYNRYKTSSITPMQRDIYMRGIPPSIAEPRSRQGYNYPHQQRMMEDPTRNRYYPTQGYPTMVPYQPSQPSHTDPNVVLYYPYEGMAYQPGGQSYRPQQQQQVQQQPLQYNQPPFLQPGAVQMPPNIQMGMAPAPLTMGSPAPLNMPQASILRMPPSTPMPPATPMAPMMGPSTPITGPTTPMATPGTPSSVMSFVSPATPAMPVPNIYADLRSRPTTAAGTPTEIVAEPIHTEPATSPQLSLETRRLIDGAIEEIRIQKNKILRDVKLGISIETKIINDEKSPTDSRILRKTRMTNSKPSHFRDLSRLGEYIKREVNAEEKLALEKIRYVMALSAMSISCDTNWEKYGETFSPDLMVHAVVGIYQALNYPGISRVECTAWVLETRKLARALELLYQELEGNEYKEEGDILKTISSSHPSAAVRPHLLPLLCQQLKAECIAKQNFKVPSVHSLSSSEIYVQSTSHSMRNTRTLRDYVRILLNTMPNGSKIPEGKDRCVVIDCKMVCTEASGRGRKKKDQERPVGSHQFVVTWEKVQSDAGDATIIKVGPFKPIRLANADGVGMHQLWNNSSNGSKTELDISKGDFGFIYCSKLYPSEDEQYANFICNQPTWVYDVFDPFTQPMAVITPAIETDSTSMFQQEPKQLLSEEPPLQNTEELRPELEAVIEKPAFAVGSDVTPTLEERNTPDVDEQPHPEEDGQEIQDDESLLVFEADSVEEALPVEHAIVQVVHQEAEQTSLQQIESIPEEMPVKTSNVEVQLGSGTAFEHDHDPMLDEQPMRDLQVEAEEAVVEKPWPVLETATTSVAEEEFDSAPTKDGENCSEICIGPSVIVQKHTEMPKETISSSGLEELEKVAVKLVPQTIESTPEVAEDENLNLPSASLSEKELQHESGIMLKTADKVTEQEHQELQRDAGILLESQSMPVLEQVEEDLPEEEEPENTLDAAFKVTEQEVEPEPEAALDVVMEDESEQTEQPVTVVERPLSIEEDEMRDEDAAALEHSEVLDAPEVMSSSNSIVIPGTMAPLMASSKVYPVGLKFGRNDVESLLQLVPHPTLNFESAIEHDLQIRIRMSFGLISAEEQQRQDFKEKQILETVHQIRISFGKCKTHYLQLENHLRPSLSVLNTPLRDISTAQNFFSSSWKYHTLYGIADCAKKLCTPNRIKNWLSDNVMDNVVEALEQIHKFTQQNFTTSEIDGYLKFAENRIEIMKQGGKYTDEMISAVAMESAYAIMCKLFISPDILKRAEKLYPCETTADKYNLQKQHKPKWTSCHTEAIDRVNNLGISISVTLDQNARKLVDKPMEEKAKELADDICRDKKDLADFMKKMILRNAKDIKPYIRQTCHEAPLKDVPPLVRDASLYLLIQDQMTSIQDSAARVILQSISKMNQFYETVKNKQEISHVPREQLVFDFEPVAYGPKIIKYKEHTESIEPKISRKDHKSDDSTDKDNTGNDAEDRRGEKRRAPNGSPGAGEPQTKMQNTSMGHGFWGAQHIQSYQPSLPSIRSGQEWDAESIISRDSGVGSSCPSILSKTPMKRKYSDMEEKGMKMSKSTSVLECSSSTTTATLCPDIRSSVEAALRLAAVEPTPSLLKYLATPLTTSPRSTTSSESHTSQPPMKRPTPSTSTRPTPLPTPNSTMDPLSVIIPSERRHSQMFDTLLDVATREYRDSRSGSEDVEVLDLSTKRNPPQSPLVSNRPTPLATPTTASTETTLLIPNTKEIERKRQRLLQQQQEEYEQQNRKEEIEMQQLQQLQEIQELHVDHYELHQPMLNDQSSQKQKQQKPQKQTAMPKTVVEARPEKRPIKVLTVLDLPPIDQEELESNTVLPKKPNTFEFHFFNRNRYTVEKNWCERKVILGKSLRAGRGKRAHCPPTAEAKQVHKMYLAGKTELKLILKGAKLDFYEMEKQWDLDHPAAGATTSPTTQPGPSTDVFVLPKDYRPISPPTTSQQCNSLVVKRVDAILASPEIIQQRVAEKSPIQLIDRPRIITKAALKELPPPRLLQAPPCVTPVAHKEIEIVEEEVEVTEQDEELNEEINVVDEEPVTVQQDFEQLEEVEEGSTIEEENLSREPSVVEEEPFEEEEQNSPIEVQHFDEENFMVENDAGTMMEGEHFERESEVAEEEYLEEEAVMVEEEYCSDRDSCTVEEMPAIYEEEDTIVEEEPAVYDEEGQEEYYDEGGEESEVIELSDSEDQDEEDDDDLSIATASIDDISDNIVADSPDFIDVIGTSSQPASPINVVKERLIFDEDREDSDDETAVDVLNDADEGVEVDVEFDDDEEQELGRLVIDETSPVSTPEPEESLAHLSTALNNLKVQLNGERKKTPEAEGIREPSPLIEEESAPAPEPSPEPHRYTSFFVEDLLRDKHTKRVDRRRKEVCHFKQLPKIPLQKPFLDLYMDRLRRTAFTAEYERRRLMEMNNCEHAFKHLYERSEWRQFMKNYPIRRARSVDSFFGRNVEEHFGEHWEFAEQRMFLEDLNLYPLVTQNILGTVLSRCNSPATIAPCHQDDTPEERAFAYRREGVFAGRSFYKSSLELDREYKLVFSDVDSDNSPPSTDYEGSPQPNDNAESTREDSTELRPSDENSVVSSADDRPETHSQYEYQSSVSSRNDLETRSL